MVHIEPEFTFYAICALLTVVCVVLLRRDRRRARRGECPFCRYSMVASPTRRCPECGRETPEDRVDTRMSPARRRGLRWLAFMGVYPIVLWSLTVANARLPQPVEVRTTILITGTGFIMIEGVGTGRMWPRRKRILDPTRLTIRFTSRRPDVELRREPGGPWIDEATNRPADLDAILDKIDEAGRAQAGTLVGHARAAAVALDPAWSGGAIEARCRAANAAATADEATPSVFGGPYVHRTGSAAIERTLSIIAAVIFVIGSAWAVHRNPKRL